MVMSKFVIVFVLQLLQLRHAEFASEVFKELDHNGDNLLWKDYLSEKTRILHESTTGEINEEDKVQEKPQTNKLISSLDVVTKPENERSSNVGVPFKTKMISVPLSIQTISQNISTAVDESLQNSLPNSESATTTELLQSSTLDLESKIITESLQSSTPYSESKIITESLQSSTPDLESKIITESLQSSTPYSESIIAMKLLQSFNPDSESSTTTESPQTSNLDSENNNKNTFWNPWLISLVSLGAFMAVSIIVISAYYIGKIRTRDKNGFPPETEPPRIIPRVRGFRNRLPSV